MAEGTRLRHVLHGYLREARSLDLTPSRTPDPPWGRHEAYSWGHTPYTTMIPTRVYEP